MQLKLYCHGAAREEGRPRAGEKDKTRAGEKDKTNKNLGRGKRKRGEDGQPEECLF